MSDFDFDELDRAVNGAIGDDSADTQNTTNSSEVSTTPESSKVSDDSSTKPSVESANSVAPAVRRSSGRFMDVVHPSSDMRSGTSSSAASARPIVQPLAQTASSASTAPDSRDAAIDATDLLEDWQKPLESPFLPDAKVEKRPLGGENPTTADFDALELLEAPDDPQIEAHAMPDPIDFASRSAEEATNLDTPSETEVEPAVVADVIDSNSEESDVKVFDKDVHSEAAGYGEGSFQPENSNETPAGPASISQQYKEQPSSTPQPGAIYDTEAYHQPVSPVAKKKSGVWIILWIVLIILLGGGAGAAFYFYVLPML